MVLPKVRRVLSGEKVVVSNLLATKFSMGTISTASAESENTPAGRQYQQRIIVRKNDPMPRIIETQVYEMEGLLGKVDNLCQEGRTVSLDLWKQMQQDVARFKMDLDKVDLQWDDEAPGDEVRAEETQSNDRLNGSDN